LRINSMIAMMVWIAGNDRAMTTSSQEICATAPIQACDESAGNVSARGSNQAVANSAPGCQRHQGSLA
jgi:hypothetical protein